MLQTTMKTSRISVPLLRVRRSCLRLLSSSQQQELEVQVGPQLIDPISLREALPELICRFDQSLNESGEFPLGQEYDAKKLADHYENDTDSSDSRQASVLVLLCSVNGAPSVLFTRRASHLTTHSGEVAFPGGHFERTTDDSLQATALREAVEELLPPPEFHDSVQVLGPTTGLPSLKGTPVAPFLAVYNKELHDPVSQVFPGDPSEVDLVFAVSLKDLLSSETSHELPKNRFNMTLAPMFPSQHGNIWGLTAYILRPLLHRLLRPVFFKQEQDSR
jgi:8-oxo-dGTP pyrophosphatase MutT (NUDIX family)